MIDFLSLVKKTSAYKIISGDKEAGRLSHAYLIVNADGKNLLSYLKVFAEIIACKEGTPCGACRTCKLIDSGNFTDLLIYPKGDAVLSEDITDLISESYIKPVEVDKKIFIINNAQNMNASAQNKLLKTLEEPPKGVYILMGTTSEFPILPTVKSRVKKLEIPEYSGSDLFSALKGEYQDEEKLTYAIASGDGTVGKAETLYGDENFYDTLKVAEDVICNMKSSKDVLTFSNKISALKSEYKDFLSALELLFRDMLCALNGREELVKNKKTFINTEKAEGFSSGSVIYALDRIGEANKKLKFNGNESIVNEWLLFQILEGKYKWRK